MKKIFKYQIWQLLVAITFIILFYYFKDSIINNSKAKLWSINVEIWFWIAVLIPIIHQFYVALVWRFELYKQTFTKKMGLEKSFKLYAFGFSVLFVSRLIFISFLAYPDKDTLEMNPVFIYIIAIIIIPLVVFLFYSVKKYFTVERAYGIDHFDKNYNVPYVKQGIFKYSNNAMYVFGLMILYLPGLLMFSKAALVVALYNHIYIWVHYYFTELPDMKEIYGKTPK